MKSESGKNGHDAAKFFIYAKLLAAAFFTGYVVFRLLTLALVSDEWGSILSDLSNGKGVVDLLVFSHVEAQLHFLQALLSLGFTKIFSEEQIILAARLPSLIGWILYLFSCWKITGKLESKVLGFLGFIALCSNASMLDYFSLARGYGLALGFTALSVFFLIKSMSGRKEIRNPNCWTILTIWSASFAVLANMALINFYVGMAMVCMHLSIDSASFKKVGFVKSMRGFLAANGYLFANAALLFIFYLPRVLLLIRGNQLYFGGTKGFVQDTVTSLVKSSFYRREIPDDLMVVIAYLLVAASLAMSSSLIFKRNAKKAEQLSLRLYFSAIVSIMALFNIVGFYLADVKFLIERAALGFLPLFIFQAIFFILESKRVSKVLGYITLIFCMALGIHGLNFHRTGDYCAYSQTPELLNDLVKIHEKTGKMVVLGVTDSTKYTLGWYAEKQAGLSENPQTKGYISGPIKQFQWFVIYSLDYAVQPDKPLHYFPETTHIALQRYMSPSKVPCKLKLLKEYPYARTCLYEVER